MKRKWNLLDPSLWGRIAVVLLCLIPQAAFSNELQSIRSEVRSVGGGSSSSGETSSTSDHRSNDHRHSSHDRHCHSYGDPDCGGSWLDGDLLLLGGLGCYLAVATPFVVPRNLTGDDGTTGYFVKYPYRKGENFITFNDADQQARRFSGRFRLEYAENFDDLSRTGGKLQLETTSRFGIDTEAHRFQEPFRGQQSADQLWLGDCNFTYRFAQSERTAWRAGFGFNWLNDPIGTDFGFNFTYGFDLYPCRPWVISTELDLGTLGSSHLYRFRSTVGVMVHRMETYVGYEYLDVAGTTFNGLIAGVGIRF